MAWIPRRLPGWPIPRCGRREPRSTTPLGRSSPSRRFAGRRMPAATASSGPGMRSRRSRSGRGATATSAGARHLGPRRIERNREEDEDQEHRDRDEDGAAQRRRCDRPKQGANRLDTPRPEGRAPARRDKVGGRHLRPASRRGSRRRGGASRGSRREGRPPRTGRAGESVALPGTRRGRQPRLVPRMLRRLSCPAPPGRSCAMVRGPGQGAFGPRMVS